MIARLPFGEFLPDQTKVSGFLYECRNVLASGDGRYTPLKAVAPFGNALPSAFEGGYSAVSSDGDGFLFAGTASALYRLSGGAWAALETGLTTNARWQFQQFGDYVVAVNGGATREIDLAGGTSAALAGAPTGTSVWVVADYVCIGRAGGEINKIATSAFRDHTGWTPGVNQSTDLPFQTGGAVMGGVGGEYGVILQRDRLVRQTRTGDALAPFQYDEISTNFGCANGNTIASAGRTVFFLSDRGFMALDDGQALRAIGSEKVNRWWDANVGRDNFDKVFTAVDPRNNLVAWGVAGVSGLLLIYNFELDRWTTGEFAFSGIMSGFDTSISLEALALTETNIDLMTTSLDDTSYSGGDPRLYVLDIDGKPGSLTGATLEAFFALTQAEVISGKRSLVRGVVPATDATNGVTVQLETRQRTGDAAIATTASNMLANGNMPIRAAGRHVGASMTIAAGTDWTFAQGLELEVAAGGRE